MILLFCRSFFVWQYTTFSIPMKGVAYIPSWVLHFITHTQDCVAPLVTIVLSYTGSDQPSAEFCGKGSPVLMLSERLLGS